MTFLCSLPGHVATFTSIKGAPQTYYNLAHSALQTIEALARLQTQAQLAHNMCHSQIFSVPNNTEDSKAISNAFIILAQPLCEKESVEKIQNYLEKLSESMSELFKEIQKASNTPSRLTNLVSQFQCEEKAGETIQNQMAELSESMSELVEKIQEASNTPSCLTNLVSQFQCEAKQFNYLMVMQQKIGTLQKKTISILSDYYNSCRKLPITDRKILPILSGDDEETAKPLTRNSSLSAEIKAFLG